MSATDWRTRLADVEAEHHEHRAEHERHRQERRDQRAGDERGGALTALGSSTGSVKVTCVGRAGANRHLLPALADALVPRHQRVLAGGTSSIENVAVVVGNREPASDRRRG